MLKNILIIIIMTATVFMGTKGTAQAMLSEPNVVYYGTATTAAGGNSVTITLDGSASPIASIKVGSDLKYVLRVPMDAFDPRTAGTARTGDAATISINGAIVAKVVIPTRGTLVKMDLAKRDAEQWAKDHPGDSGSGDMNRNGVSDLQDYLNNNDPAGCVWKVVDAGHAETDVFHPQVLKNCLADAGADLKHNLIRVARGTYPGNFSYIPASGEDYDLTLIGGYDPAGVAERSADSALTALNGDTDNDGVGNGITLVVDTDTGKTHGKVHVESLTLKNGKAPAGQKGGGIQAHIYQGGLELVGNIISGNSADSGGGLSVESSDSAPIILTNNVLYGNSAANAAAMRIVSASAGPVTLLNNSIADNTATANGDGRSLLIESTIASVDMTNNIISASSGVSGSDIFINSSGVSIPLVITHNAYDAVNGLLVNAPGFVPDATTIIAAPMFVAPLTGNYRLSSNSPCIDQGIAHGKQAATDAGGEGRISGSGADLGAYEFHGSVTTPATAVSVSSATLNGTVNANNAETTVHFEYGADTGYGSTVAAVPGTVTGVSDTAVSAVVSGLSPGVYHFRVVAVSNAGTAYGGDQSFTLMKSVATVTLGSLNTAYDGTPKAATVTTIPAGLAVNLTYNGSSTAPTAVGSYNVAAVVNNPNYTGTTNGTLVIASSITSVLNLTLSTLADGATTSNAIINISGTVTAVNGIQGITSNGAAVSFSANGSFSYPVTLVPDSNTITIVATDKANFTTTVTRTFTLDATAPLITLTSGQTDNSVTSSPQATMSGNIDNATSTVTISINGGTPQPAIMTGTGFSLPVTLTSGLNTIVITATDVTGKSSSIKQSITLNSALALAITSPAHDLKSGNANLTLTGTVDGIAPLTVIVAMDGQSFTPTVTNGSFNQALTFAAEKNYPIVVTASDGSGNSANVTRNVIYAWLGNSDGSGSASLGDTLRAFRIALKLEPATASDLLRYDVAPLDANGKPQGNGVIDIGDVVLLLRNQIGLLSW